MYLEINEARQDQNNKDQNHIFLEIGELVPKDTETKHQVH